jgi:hypothetical protein
MTRILAASVGLAAAALGMGYIYRDLWIWTLAIVALGLLWLFGLWRRWEWASSAGWILYTAGAAAGLLQGAGFGWMLFGLSMALIAWDLDAFGRRLQSAQRVERKEDLERRHLLRLAVVSAMGWLLAAIAIGARLELGFGVVLLLALLAAFGLSRTLALARRQSR